MNSINLNSKSKEQQKVERTLRKTSTIFWSKVFELLLKVEIR
jgi:hypothetical protein